MMEDLDFLQVEEHQEKAVEEEVLEQQEHQEFQDQDQEGLVDK
jgi:hypothetical protein